jgi:hypothetical protein
MMDWGFLMSRGLRVYIAALTAAAVVMPACSYSKEAVALNRDEVGTRVPNQQRLLALSTDEAVARLDFKPLAGKKVIVEISGVFPHSRNEVLDYIEGQVEGKIARDGGLVIAAEQVVVVPDAQAGSGATAGPIPNATLSLTPNDADFRVLIGVSWGGVDTNDRQELNTSLLGKQLGVIGGGVLAALIGAATGDATTASVLGGLGGLAVIGGSSWVLVQRPTAHVYRLLGRVRLSVNAIPIVPGGTAFQTIGEGQTELVIDETADEGYQLTSGEPTSGK